MNLEPCSNCGTGDWGWTDTGYWRSQPTSVSFASSGGHTIRVQTREDGAQIDQLVLSPSNYLYNAPGRNSGDTTILPDSAGARHVSRLVGRAVIVPLVWRAVGVSRLAAGMGKIEAQDFDNGGEGIAYHDTSRRTTAERIARPAWTSRRLERRLRHRLVRARRMVELHDRGALCRPYTVALRVASSGGGSLHVGFNTASHVWHAVSVPNTGGWQTWTTVSFTATLGAGVQQMTLMADRRQ